MRLTDLLTAFMLLTRLPVARFLPPGPPPGLARCVWAFPIVGLAVNAAGGLTYALANTLGTPPLLAAIWTLVVTMLATGAFHEDGLADTADGFGGGDTPSRKLAIMRDSRIGTYGALALLLSTTLRIAAITALDQPLRVTAAMIAAGALGRAGMLVVLLASTPARQDGMAAAMGQPKPTTAALGLAIAVLTAFATLPPRPALIAAALCFAASLTMARLANAQIHGHTGDILGATEVVTECVVLTALASALAR